MAISNKIYSCVIDSWLYLFLIDFRDKVSSGEKVAPLCAVGVA